MDMNYNPPWPESELRADGLFQALMKTAVDGVMVIDAHGTIQAYNPACERLFQFTPADVLGQNVKMLMPAPYRGEHDNYLKHYRETGEAKVIGIGREVSGQRKDGSTFPMYLSVGEGTLYGERVFVGIVHDLSSLYGEREAFEARLLDVREDLERVARVSELGQVAAGIAHEMNQPLTAMMNYCNAAKRLAASGKPGDAEKSVAMLAKVSEQAERAGQIVRRMRDFLEKRAATRGAEDVVAIVDDAMALGLIGAKSANVKARFVHEPNLPLVTVDRVQIQQVLVNLLRNAVEAMAEVETRKITLTLSRTHGGDRVLVQVADTGPGISPAIVEKLFTPFVTTKTHGMGIGLAISKSIIEAHGSDLAARPNTGGGTVFEFSLPAADDPAQTAPAR